MGVARARQFAMKLNMNLAIVDKRREVANKSEVMNIIGNVEGKTVILLDDMVDTAGSLCGAAKALIEVGGAKEIYACATHGVLSRPALERIEESPIKELKLCDTIPYPVGEPRLEKINYVSVDRLAGSHSPYLRGSFHLPAVRVRYSYAVSFFLLAAPNG